MSDNSLVLLKQRLQQILTHKNLQAQRDLIQSLSAELGVETGDFAAALLYLTHAKIAAPSTVAASSVLNYIPELKMLRYRLNVGSNHQISIEELKKVLIDESGVDRKHLNYFNMQGDYTIVELPDAMPADIFQHLKSVEINQQKLAIKRIKPRSNKKRGKHHLRRPRTRPNKPADDTSCNDA